MRQRTESQATVPATDRIVEVNEGTTSEVRNLMLEYTPKEKQETAEDATVIPAVSQGGPVLRLERCKLTKLYRMSMGTPPGG